MTTVFIEVKFRFVSGRFECVVELDDLRPARLSSSAISMKKGGTSLVSEARYVQAP
jgi:hypothetical protein